MQKQWFIQPYVSLCYSPAMVNQRYSLSLNLLSRQSFICLRVGGKYHGQSDNDSRKCFQIHVIKPSVVGVVSLAFCLDCYC